MSRLATTFVTLVSGSGLALAVVSAGFPAPTVVQPLAFSHGRHAEFEIECEACHDGVKTSEFARLPALETCLECHEDEEAESPEMATLQAHLESGQEIPWRRLYRLPAHVQFSHERHVGIGEVACRDCHGDHGTSDTPPARPEDKVLTMEGCMECHRSRGILNDCIECHR